MYLQIWCWKATEHILGKFLVPPTNHLIGCYTLRTIITVSFIAVGLLFFTRDA